MVHNAISNSILLMWYFCCKVYRPVDTVITSILEGIEYALLVVVVSLLPTNYYHRPPFTADCQRIVGGVYYHLPHTNCNTSLVSDG